MIEEKYCNLTLQYPSKLLDEKIEIGLARITLEIYRRNNRDLQIPHLNISSTPKKLNYHSNLQDDLNSNDLYLALIKDWFWHAKNMPISFEH